MIGPLTRAIALRFMWMSLSATGLCVTASAHHSVAATYITREQLTIDGVIVQLEFRNPHSFIQVIVKDEKGAEQRWAVECGGVAVLARNNLTTRTLRPGDRVLITGLPGRNPADHRLLLMSIVRPADGWKWTMPGA